MASLHSNQSPCSTDRCRLENHLADNTSKEIEELKRILRRIGPESIWRPVVTPDGQLLADGIGDENDGILRDIRGLDFQGKTVIDLGCNLGYYCFVAKKAGAARVLGIDCDERIIRGCNIIKQLYGVDDVDFQAMDITALSNDLACDIGMMIDFIGKNSIIAGMLPKFLDALESVSRREMILSIRPAYRIAKHLGNDTRGLLRKYPEKYVRNGRFYNMEYVADRFRSNWRIDILTSPHAAQIESKETVLMRRKRP
jgi:predicted nicotinamide N-methyase